MSIAIHQVFSPLSQKIPTEITQTVAIEVPIHPKAFRSDGQATPSEMQKRQRLRDDQKFSTTKCASNSVRNLPRSAMRVDGPAREYTELPLHQHASSSKRRGSLPATQVCHIKSHPRRARHLRNASSQKPSTGNRTESDGVAHTKNTQRQLQTRERCNTRHGQ